VDLQVGFVVGGITTNVTYMILLLSMDISLMFANFALALECFVTYVADKWPLLAVSANMAL